MPTPYGSVFPPSPLPGTLGSVFNDLRIEVGQLMSMLANFRAWTEALERDRVNYVGPGQMYENVDAFDTAWLPAARALLEATNVYGHFIIGVNVQGFSQTLQDITLLAPPATPTNGLLRRVGLNWVFDTNTYLTAAANETITGSWAFTAPVVGMAPTAPLHLTTKNYVDTALATLASTISSQTTGFATTLYVDTAVSSRATLADITAAIAPFPTTAAMNTAINSAVAPLVTSSAMNAAITAAVAPFPTTTAMNTAISSAVAPLSSVYVHVDGTSTMTGALNMGTHKITNLSDPTLPTDAASQKYVDTADYLNVNPKVGLMTSDSKLPIYSDFKFALGVWGTNSFSFVDSESKQVLYYHAANPLGRVSVFRAYRFSDVDSFIFDNEEISATFLNPNERVGNIANMGTNFLFLRLCGTAAPWGTTRWVLVRSYGSSRWQDWTLAYDVSSIITRSNFYLLQDPVRGDRILQLEYASDGSQIVLSTLGPNLAKDWSQILFDRATDVDYNDYVIPGSTGGSINISYNPLGLPHAFTWDPFTETLYQKNVGYYVRTRTNGAKDGVGFCLNIAWTVPRVWVTGDTYGGTNNLIPIKNGTARYNVYPDSTWNTETGGMSTTYGTGSQPYTLVTDEYSGNIYMTGHDTFSTTTAGVIYRLGYSNGKQYQTLGGPYLASYFLNALSVSTPDGSAWSKMISAERGQIIGNNISFVGYSNRYGSKEVNATFSTSVFTSVARANDTLKISATDAVISPVYPAGITDNSYGLFGTTVLNGEIPIHYWAMPGHEVHTGTAVGVTRTWTPTGLIMPALPTTIGVISGLVSAHTVAWNGDMAAPVFWVVVHDANYYFYVAKCDNGSWSIPGSRIIQDLTDIGNSSRGDTSNIAYGSRAAGLLTELGKWIFSMAVPVISDTAVYCIMYDTAIDIHIHTGQFVSVTGGATPSDYPISTSNGSASYGFTPELGYYSFKSSNARAFAVILSSKDIHGIGSARTENEWFYNTMPRYEMFVSTESATGLVAYVSEYPIFLGGYYTKVPTTTLALTANAVNYIYASKDQTDRSAVTVSTSTTKLSNSFSRLLLGAVTTNATNVVSSETYSFDGIGLPAQANNTGKILTTDGDKLYWGDVVATPSYTPGAVAEMGRYIDMHGGGTPTDYDVRFDCGTGTGVAGGGTLNISASGGLINTGNVSAYSDERLKSDWSALPSDFISQLANVKAGTFTRIDTEQRQVGVSAQSLQPLLPEAVIDDGTYLSVAYGNAALVASIELAKEVIALKAIIADLVTQLKR